MATMLKTSSYLECYQLDYVFGKGSFHFIVVGYYIFLILAFASCESNEI